MLTITHAQEKALSSSARSVHVKVEIDRGSGSEDWVDLTEFEGRNWVTSVNMRQSVDSRVGTATIGLFREFYNYSLSPLDTDSKLNASGTICGVSNAVKIYTATMGQGSTPSSSDFTLVFEGRIDSVAFEKPNVVVRCSDKMGVLTSTFIETIREYGDTKSAGGISMPVVLQEIIDDNINDMNIAPYSSGSPLKVYSVNGTGGTPFPVGDYPGFNIISYRQQKMTVMAALQAVVANIGYDLRWDYHPNTSSYQLVFKTIDRSTTTSMRTFNSSQYFDITKLSVSVKDIRNVVRVTWGPVPSDRDAGIDNRASVTVPDNTSIAKYGRRFMQIVEASMSQIDSDPEALTLCNYAISDLAEPNADVSVNMPYFFAAMLNDYYTFSASDEPRFSSDQSFAVVAIAHDFKKTGANTSLTMRGKPTGGAKQWLGIESRPGVPEYRSGQEDDTPPDATGVSAVPTIGGMTIGWTDPLNQEPPMSNWEYTEVHVSPAAGFTPSDSTLQEFSRTNNSSITDLTPGATYYTKILHRDRRGRISAAGSATQVSESTQTVGPYHMSPDWRFGVVVQNGDFNITTLDVDDDPPDGWTNLVGQWGVSDEMYYKDTEAFTASGGISFWSRNNSTASRTLFSRRFPVSHLETYINRITYKVTAAQAGNSLSATVYWWKVDGSSSASTATSPGAYVDLGGAGLSVNTWNEAATSIGLAPPSDARFASIAVVINPAGGSQDVYVDSITLNACPVAVGVVDSGGFAVPKTGGYFEADDIAARGFNSGAWDNSTHYFTVPHAGLYRASFWGDCLGLTAGVTWQFQLYYRDNSGSGSPTAFDDLIVSGASDGSNCVMYHTWPTNGKNLWRFEEGNQITLYVKHNEAASVTRNLSTDSVFSMWEVTNGLI